jgi:hypothetical protein
LYVNGYLANSGTVSDLSAHNISNGLMDGMAVAMPAAVEVQLDEVRVFAQWRDLATIRAQMSQPLSSAGSSTIHAIHATFNARTYNSNPPAVVKASSRLVGPRSTLITTTTTSATGAVLLTAPTLSLVSGGGGVVTWHNQDDIGGRAVTGYRLSISLPGGTSCVQRAYYEAPSEEPLVPRVVPVPSSPSDSPSDSPYYSPYSLVKDNTIDVPPLHRSIRIVGLLPSTTYHVCVGIVNGFEPRLLSPTGTLTTSAATKPGVPPAPTQNSSATTEWDQLAVQWADPADTDRKSVV